MTIKVLLLKSGEDVIADVQEMLSSEENVMGYLLDRPCVIKVRTKEKTPSVSPFSKEVDIDEKPKPETTVAMYPWMPLAKEQVIPLTIDWVVTMYTAQDKIEEMYKQDVLKNFKKDDQTDNTDQPVKTGLTD